MMNSFQNQPAREAPKQNK